MSTGSSFCYTSCFDTTDAQIERPYTAMSRFDTTDARAVRPYKGLLVSSFDNGRPPTRY